MDQIANWDRAVLYGEPGREDLSKGKVLVAGQYLSEGGLFDSDRCPTSADVWRCGAWTMARTPVPNCYEDCYYFVMGRNVSDEEVRRAVDAASFTETAPSSVKQWAARPSIPPTALPSGVERLVTAPMSVAGFRSPGSQYVTYDRTDTKRLSLFAADGGEALFELYRFFIADDGSTPPFADWGGDAAIASIRLEGRTTIVALATGISRSELDDFVNAVHRDRGGEWDRLRTETTTRAPEDVLGRVGPPYAAVLSGKFSSGQWVVGIQPFKDTRYHVLVQSYGPDPRDHSGGGSGSFDAGSGDRLVVWPVIFLGGTNFTGTVYAGVAPAATESVRVTYDGQNVTAAVGAKGALPSGGRFWAAFIEHPDVRPSSATVVVASDANGSEVGRVEQPAT